MARFATKARTLAMLGRQQVAGIPTAISELFKNAHDAYAKTAEIDYYRSDGLFVLRDDGVGMEPEAFLDSWLTIGTDSKLPATHVPRRPPGEKERPMLGEKGIGRLSIAAIGPQVLIMTRAWRPNGASDLTVAFINWSVFEWPAVTLADIDIPVRVIEGGALPTKTDVESMVDDFRAACHRLKPTVDTRDLSRLDDELNSFSVDPHELDAFCPRLSLRGTRSGTHFVLLPTSSLLAKDIDGDGGALAGIQPATPLQQGLWGFRLSMVPDAAPPNMAIAFRDHASDESCTDIVSDGEFFTQDEFLNADHRFVGRFDDYGQFTGEIYIYGEKIDRDVVPWRNTKGRPTKCGPFTFHLAVVERRGVKSTLPPDDHARMTQKMMKIGGLYIYRDGIRMLPYGNVDYDWLGIEVRRTKSAKYYYFSHRKMFGAIQLTSSANGNLKEKAGREGFLENIAYRELKNILQSFLLQVAATCFRDEFDATVYRERQAEMVADRLTIERRQKQVRAQRKQLAQNLDDFFSNVSNDQPNIEVAALAEHVETRVQRLDAIRSSSEREKGLRDVESYANAELRAIEKRYRIVRPRIALSKSAQEEWERYRTKHIDLATKVFVPARHLLDSLLSEAGVSESDQRRPRAETTLSGVAAEITSKANRKKAEVLRKADRVSSQLRDDVTQCVTDMRIRLDDIWSTFYRTDVTAGTAADFVDALARLEDDMLSAGDQANRLLDAIAAQLEALDTTGQSSPLDQLVAVEQRNQALEEQLDMDSQLAHIGMAVEIINHEFGMTVRTLRNNLRRLKAWADANPELDDLYSAIRMSFDHLDGYLKMFTPLQRRLYRKRIDIRGAEIGAFLRELFRARFNRHGILFRCTRSFLDGHIHSYPSSIYPVFINLLDNAIYWLSFKGSPGQRRIELDAKGDQIWVCDNGPGIVERDRQRIFDFGYTTKPGGRGMGLYVARETLQKVGYRISVVDDVDRLGATFVLEPAP